MTTVYLVSAVSYGSDHKINLLRQHEDTGGAIEKGELVERAKVASNIKKGMIYRIIRRSSKSWIVGQRITAKKTKSDYCIKTRFCSLGFFDYWMDPSSNLGHF